MRNACEFLLFGTNDKSFRPLEATTTSNLLLAPRPRVEVKVEDGTTVTRQHSFKPPEAYRLIRRNSPGPRVSLFQRRPVEGFEIWGDGQ